MVDYAGFVFSVPELYQLDLSDSFNAGLDRAGPYGVVEGMEGLVGTLTHTGATARQTHALNGVLIPSFADDFFGHIIIRPARLDLGNLVSSQVRQIEVANTFLVSRVWQGITNNAGAGITLNGLPSFPTTIVPFGNRFYDVSVSLLGPPTIDGTLDHDFDVLDIALPITGSRVTLISFLPQSSIEEVLEWSTEILEAHDGTEQRYEHRLAPRQRISYELITSGELDMRFRALLFDWLARVFAVPIWWEQRPLTAPISLGATVVNVLTDFADFRVGGLIMLYASPTAAEVLEIESFTATTVTLASPTLAAYPLGSIAMPVRTAYANTTPSQARYQTNPERTKLEFLTLDNANLASTAGATIYDSKVILLDPNFMDATLPEGFQRPVTVIDNQAGRVYQISRTDRSRNRGRKRWEAKSSSDVWTIRRLLHAFAGSRVSFFVPSFRADFVATATIAQGGTTVRVRFANYTNFVGSRRPYGDLRLLHTNGTNIIRRITGSTEDGAEEVISVNTAFDTSNPITVAQIQRLELVSMMRVADDKAKFTHVRVGEATVEVELIGTKE